jgi:hypothetical protein
MSSKKWLQFSRKWHFGEIGSVFEVGLVFGE